MSALPCITAALDIIGAAPMSPDVIRREIAGINTALPSNVALVSAAAALNQADTLAAQRGSARAVAEQSYNAAKTAHDTTSADLSATNQRYADAQALVARLE